MNRAAVDMENPWRNSIQPLPRRKMWRLYHGICIGTWNIFVCYVHPVCVRTSTVTPTYVQYLEIGMHSQSKKSHGTKSS